MGILLLLSIFTIILVMLINRLINISKFISGDYKNIYHLLEKVNGDNIILNDVECYLEKLLTEKDKINDERIYQIVYHGFKKIDNKLLRNILKSAFYAESNLSKEYIFAYFPYEDISLYVSCDKLCEYIDLSLDIQIWLRNAIDGLYYIDNNELLKCNNILYDKDLVDSKYCRYFIKFNSNFMQEFMPLTYSNISNKQQNLENFINKHIRRDDNNVN